MWNYSFYLTCLGLQLMLTIFIAKSEAVAHVGAVGTRGLRGTVTSVLLPQDFVPLLQKIGTTCPTLMRTLNALACSCSHSPADTT